MLYIITRIDGNGKKYYLKNGSHHDHELGCAVYQWTPNKHKAWKTSKANANAIRCNISERYKPQLEEVPEEGYYSVSGSTATIGSWHVCTYVT